MITLKQRKRPSKRIYKNTKQDTSSIIAIAKYLFHEIDPEILNNTTTTYLSDLNNNNTLTRRHILRVINIGVGLGVITRTYNPATDICKSTWKKINDNLDIEIQHHRNLLKRQTVVQILARNVIAYIRYTPRKKKTVTLQDIRDNIKMEEKELSRQLYDVMNVMIVLNLVRLLSTNPRVYEPQEQLYQLSIPFVTLSPPPPLHRVMLSVETRATKRRKKQIKI